MATTSWNDEEEDALDYLPWDAQILYMRGLRRFMDYKTGIVGIKRRISRKGLCEVLEVNPRVGSRRVVKPMTKDGLRALFRLLMHPDVGLVARVDGYENTLVFRLPLACFDKKQGSILPDAGQSASVSSAPGTHPERTPKSAPSTAPMDTPSESFINAPSAHSAAPSFTPMSAPGAHPPYGESSALHPESVNRKETIAALVVIPPARVDRLAVECALQKCFVGSPGVTDRRDVQLMIDRWMAAAVEVKPEHVTGAVSQIRDSEPNFGFGPMYLEPVVLDVASGKRVRQKSKDEPVVLGGARWSERQVEFESAVHAADKKTRDWGKANNMPFNPLGRETAGDYLLRVRTAMRKQGGKL